MVLALLLALMTAVVLITVIAPLIGQRHAAADRGSFDRAVYRDQLRELERDVARGLIDPAEAATARIEIERRLLATETLDKGSAGNSRPAPWAAGAIALLLAAGSGALYLFLGAPNVPDMPFAARQVPGAAEASAEQNDLQKSAAALTQRLAQNPRDGGAWLMLARTESVLGAWDKTADAYHHALDLMGSRIEIVAAYAEALTQAAGGIVTPDASTLFHQVLAQDPSDPVARYYLALAAAQAGDARGAIAAWQKLAADLPEGSPIRSELADRIAATAASAGIAAPPLAAAAPGPDAAAMAAAAQMTPEQSSAMIRGMVAKLADEVQQRPDDLDGWLKLGRSYGVLGEPDKAADAFEHAASLKPQDASIPFDEAQTLLNGHSPNEPIPPRALAALQRVQALDPDEPAVLWYLGLAAAQARRFDDAAATWQKLLDKLPPDGSQHRLVAEAIQTLKTKAP